MNSQSVCVSLLDAPANSALRASQDHAQRAAQFAQTGPSACLIDLGNTASLSLDRELRWGAMLQRCAQRG